MTCVSTDRNMQTFRVRASVMRIRRQIRSRHIFDTSMTSWESRTTPSTSYQIFPGKFVPSISSRDLDSPQF
ncbi:hypothetical protein EUGRSUZ_I02399 [Eucalyptus grandis]|uniref:Uncharacterized protein n=2 Tax=Eucalyptus grandis TaxID=71139 RepID=A0ACC3JJ74_EUCGR|nr:hypothetical protein EUGRSUZ_I02399 [Eucalyptus grandis]